MSELSNTQVQKSVLFKQSYTDLVQKTVLLRKEIKQSQNDMAKWVGVERRRYIKFEKAEAYDFELLLLVCIRLSIDITIFYRIN
jgi:DNA-binding XRE family transcriptional regulator